MIYKGLSLLMQILFLNGVEFLDTLSRKIRPFNDYQIPTCTALQLSNYQNKIIRLCKLYGFTSEKIVIGMESEKVSDKVDYVEVNTTKVRENVGDIDLGIRLIKKNTKEFYFQYTIHNLAQKIDDSVK